MAASDHDSGRSDTTRLRPGPDGHFVPSGPRLTRARHGGVVTGLCAGIAKLVGARVSIVRAVFVAGGVVTLGTLGLAYLGLSAIVPASAD
ncbi:MAG TPA: PspC domain-containing protein [Trueperaceae bacterium]